VSVTKCEQIAATALRGRSILDGMSAPAVPAPLAALPNALTLMRLALIPVFVVLLVPADDGRSVAAGIVFGVAGISDYLDGWLARRWSVQSAFGRVADPLADRLMIDAAVILLVVVHDRLPWIALGIVILRDVLLIAGYKLLMPRGYELNVNFLGKAATWVLYCALVFVMWTESSANWPLWLFWFGVALAIAAAAQYVFTAVRERSA
jgi:CDP-diacylglycerol--glycerol-3-phosphate 3-phosphatidyltransferase